MTTKVYRIYTHENINGIGFLNDFGEKFDTWREAFDRKEQLQKENKLPNNNHKIVIQ